MSAERIILQARVNLFEKPGGDTIQIRELEEGLRQNGLRVKISIELRPDLTSFDVVHLFNITRVHETYIQMVNAKKQHKPVVCSTVYHPLQEYNRKGRFGLGKLVFRLIRSDEGFEYLRGCYHILRNWRQAQPVFHQWAIGYRKQQHHILSGADRIIFGSESEKRTVFSDFDDVADAVTYAVVKIGIPPGFCGDHFPSFEKRYGFKDFVLCVGRIEDLKNQLTLLKAMKGLNIPLVLAGSLNSAQHCYGRKVLNALSTQDNWYFTGHLNKGVLASAYGAAKVHALPSWFETTGLSSLEAGILGCNLVSTDRGYARDYLEDYAWYCDPARPSSIRKAILAAFNAPVRTGLKEHIKRELDFQKMLERIIKIYHEVM